MTQFLGLANQNCAGSPQGGAAQRRLFTAFNPGDTSWVVPASGYYTFTIYGAGGATNGGVLSGSGAAAQKTVLLFFGQVVLFTIGYGAQAGTGVNGGTTTITFPSGEVMTATGGQPAGGIGAASGGDLNVPGNASGDAPDIGSFKGALHGLGLAAGAVAGVGASGGTSGGSSSGGPGILYLHFGKV